MNTEEILNYNKGMIITVFAIQVLLVVLRIYVALAIFQLYRDLEAGDN